MNDEAYRLLVLRKTLNLSQEQFANKIGLKGSSICDIEHGRANLTQSNKLLICSIFSVNLEWLENGLEPMFNEKNPYFDEFFQIFSTLNPTLQKFLLDTAKHLLDIQDELF